jgi:hypothetical protein
MSRPIVAFALLSLATAAPAVAQSAYAPPGDTLRYRETMKTSVIISTPQGEIPVTGEQNATVALVRLPGDSARAWFEALALAVSSPQGEQKPATEEALKKPYRLTFDSRGRVSLVEAPKFPDTFAGIGDLAHEFNDFFLRLPAKPLRVGLTWTDTLERRDSTAERSARLTSIADYKVERDTVVNGVASLVVRMKQRLTLHAEGPVPNQPVRSEAALEGSDDGFFVFAPKSGRVLARRRTGQLSGEVNIAAAGMTMKQALNYTSTVDAVK